MPGSRGTGLGSVGAQVGGFCPTCSRAGSGSPVGFKAGPHRCNRSEKEFPIAGGIRNRVGNLEAGSGGD